MLLIVTGEGHLRAGSCLSRRGSDATCHDTATVLRIVKWFGEKLEGPIETSVRGVSVISAGIAKICVCGRFGCEHILRTLLRCAVVHLVNG
jgi:hypothetical protein